MVDSSYEISITTFDDQSLQNHLLHAIDAGNRSTKLQFHCIRLWSMLKGNGNAKSNHNKKISRFTEIRIVTNICQLVAARCSIK